MLTGPWHLGIFSFVLAPYPYVAIAIAGKGGQGASHTPSPVPRRLAGKVAQSLLGCDGAVDKLRARPICYEKDRGTVSVREQVPGAVLALCDAFFSHPESLRL